MSTPAGRSSRISESTVFGVGLWMSISRLCVRISKCSRESLSLNGLSRLHDVAGRPVQLLMVVALQADSDLLCHRRSLVPSLVGSIYLMTSVTTPAPTVRPPSRIAKRSPSSMAIGWISSISMFVLSPGMTISWPSGSLIEPVTSVVRK
jgi:hypothetical protein